MDVRAAVSSYQSVKDVTRHGLYLGSTRGTLAVVNYYALIVYIITTHTALIS